MNPTDTAYQLGAIAGSFVPNAQVTEYVDLGVRKLIRAGHNGYLVLTKSGTRTLNAAAVAANQKAYR